MSTLAMSQQDHGLHSRPGAGAKCSTKQGPGWGSHRPPAPLGSIAGVCALTALPPLKDTAGFNQGFQYSRLSVGNVGLLSSHHFLLLKMRGRRKRKAKQAGAGMSSCTAREQGCGQHSRAQPSGSPFCQSQTRPFLIKYFIKR